MDRLLTQRQQYVLKIRIVIVPCVARRKDDRTGLQLRFANIDLHRLRNRALVGRPRIERVGVARRIVEVADLEGDLGDISSIGYQVGRSPLLAR